MQVNVPNSASGVAAVKLVTARGTQKIHITVLSATATNAVNIGHDRGTLEGYSALLPAGGGGIQITQAEGTVEVEWSGDLWAIGNPANSGTSVWLEFDCSSKVY